MGLMPKLPKAKTGNGLHLCTVTVLNEGLSRQVRRKPKVVVQLHMAEMQTRNAVLQLSNRLAAPRYHMNVGGLSC